jgi:superfamily I DNA/RNA helicase
MDFAECQDARQLRIALRRVFEPRAGGASSVTLSSIHRAKGLEWDCVMLLDGWRIEPVWLRRRAIEQPDGQAPAQLAQERNLRYVAETRTRHTLVLANLEDFR